MAYADVPLRICSLTQTSQTTPLYAQICGYLSDLRRTATCTDRINRYRLWL